MSGKKTLSDITYKVSDLDDTIRAASEAILDASMYPGAKEINGALEPALKRLMAKNAVVLEDYREMHKKIDALVDEYLEKHEEFLFVDQDEGSE